MAEITIRVSDKAIRVVLMLLVATLLVWGAIQIETSGILRPKYEIKMVTANIFGVAKGSSVRLNGMPVGKVGKVKFTGNWTDAARRVELSLKVEKQFQSSIPIDSTASVVTEGLLGEGYVNIVPGVSGAPLQSGEEIRVPPTKELGVGDFLDALGRLAKCKDHDQSDETSKSKVTANGSTVRK